MLVFGEVFSGRRVGSCITPQLPCSVHLKDKRRNETWLIGASVIVTTRLSVDVSDTIFEVVGVITEVAVTAEGLIVVCLRDRRYGARAENRENRSRNL
jgi:hypothetical protein